MVPATLSRRNRLLEKPSFEAVRSAFFVFGRTFPTTPHDRRHIFCRSAK